jgi:hypothetical protein
MNYEEWVGQKVRKVRTNNRQPKPFKSGFKVNTVAGVINHPIRNVPAFTFKEDDSYVDCRSCQLEN